MKFHSKQVLGVLRPPRKRRMASSKRNSSASSCSTESPIHLLPDALLSCIISTLRDAVDIATASVVCKRWNLCAKYVDVLRFNTGDEDVDDWAKQGSALGWIRIIHRSLALKKLCIASSGYPWDFNREMYLLMCIVHACPQLEVLELDLGLTIRSRFMDTVSKFKHLTELHFANTSDIVEFFPGSSDFTALRKCSMASFRLMDSLLEEFVSQCPVLEELVVVDCFGLTKPRLKSESLTSLTFKASDCVDGDDEYEEDTGVTYLKIVAPNLRFLSIEYVHQVICDGAQLRELDVRSCVEPRFKHLPKLETLRTTWPADMLMKLLRAGHAAKHVVISNLSSGEAMIPLPAEEMLQTLTKVESLEIGGDPFKALSYSIASKSTRTIRFVNLKKLCLWMSVSNEPLIKFMLESSPVLEVLRICISQLDTSSAHSILYLRRLLALQRAYPRVTFDLEVPSQEFKAP